MGSAVFRISFDSWSPDLGIPPGKHRIPLATAEQFVYPQRLKGGLMNQSPDPPSSGRIDIHTHLLPGIDDGCRDIEQALTCVRAWMAAGFVGSICTPHVGPGFFQENTPDNIEQWVPELRQAIASAGLNYKLWDGGEVRILPETIEWFSYWGLPTLGEGNCVLLDWWGTEWPDYCVDCCQFLIDNGYQPVLAHPERMDLPDDVWEVVLQNLESRGVWLQGNFNSIGGGEGKRCHSRAWSLLRDDRYRILASDTHQPTDLSQRLSGLAEAEQEFGAEYIQLLTEERPREVLKSRIL